MDEKEEGEISLEDVSSSEETNHNTWIKKAKKSNMSRRHDKRVEVDILPQDAVYGKENRQFSNELHVPEMKPKPAILEDSKDGLLPISSEDEIEVIRLPGSSERMLLNCGKARKKKKKKKKKSGPRLLVMDDLESSIEVTSFPARITGEEVAFVPRNHYETSETVHKIYSPPSGKLHRSPVKHFKTSFHHPRSPSPHRRSPRGLSPIKSSAIPNRHSQYKSTRDYSSRNNTYALLKKVRQYDNKYKETSLKDKLFNKIHVLKSENDNHSKENKLSENSSEMKTEIDDEEDVDQLRRAALETKLQKNEKMKGMEEANEIKAESEDNSSGINYNAGDQDEEDLQLRMIALRSAVLKKHHDRVQRGVVKKNKNTNKLAKSPSSDILDDLFNGDLSDNDLSPINDVDSLIESLIAEDMDLDSDVEREKEKPYSPTDNLSDGKYSEVEVPVELANKILHDSYLNNTVSPDFNHSPILTYDNEFYPQTKQMVNLENSYSSSEPARTLLVDRYLRPDQFNYTASYLKPPLSSGVDETPSNIRAQTPYSPSDSTIFDPELPVCPSELAFAENSIITPHVPYPNNSYLDKSMARPYNNISSIASPPMDLNKASMPTHYSRDPRRAAATTREMVTTLNQGNQILKNIPERTSLNNLEQPKELINADPRTNRSYIPNKNQNDDRFHEIVNSLKEYTGEPAYLQGVPQVTKDANKIPTLVNRTLVPVPILKTNKQLQQKLTVKKVDTPVKKVFKNAQMQPVEISSQSKVNSQFKPIKLQPNVRKIQLIPVPTKQFNGNSIDLSTSADKNLENSNIVDVSNNTVSSTAESEVKKRGRGRPKTPTLRKNSVKKTPTKEISTEKGNITKTISKSTGKRVSKDNNDKEVDKSVVPDKNNEVKKPIPRRRRSESISGKKDENSKNYVESNKNKEETKQKRESIHRAVKDKIPKVSEINSKENDKNKQDGDKKRRLSADEDEETLRASLIASLSKRSKPVDDLTEKRQINNAKEKQPIKNTTVHVKPTLSTSKNNLTGLNHINTLTNTTSFNDEQKISNTKVTTANVTSNLLLASRKRAAMTEVSGPSEKILKKATAFRNVDTSYKNPIKSTNSKMSSKNLSRVVINLGEDTDSDSDSSFASAAPVTSTPDLSKKIDEFLKSQREKQETSNTSGKVKVIPPKSTGHKTATSDIKKTTLASTPQAVRHLPAARQEEYRRLKQQLVEIEKQKLNKASEKNLQKSAKNQTKKTVASDSAPVTSAPSTSSSSTVSNKLITSSNIPSRIDENQVKCTAQESLINIPKPMQKPSSAASTIENLQPSIETSSIDNSLDTLSANEQQLLLPIDFSIKLDPSDSHAIVDESKANQLQPAAITEDVSQTLSNEFHYNVPLESLGIRENLIIQISNTRDENITNYRRVRISKNTDSVNETMCSAQSAPVLRILTTAQLNMKLESPSTSSTQEVNEEKVQLDESGQIITQNKVIAESSQVFVQDQPATESSQNLVQNMSTIENTYSDNILDNQIIEEVTKTETIFDSCESVIVPTIQPKEESMSMNFMTNESETSTLNDAESVNQNTGKIKSEIEDDIENYIKLPIEDQKAELAKMENNLVKKRYVVLSDLTEMAEHLQQWETERETEFKLTDQAKRLKYELMKVEECLKEQKAKINNMGPKISKVHNMVYDGRAECFKITKFCQRIGTNISGTDYRIPSYGDKALSDKFAEVLHHSQQLSEKSKTMNNNNNADNNLDSMPSCSDKNNVKSSKPEISSSNEQSTPLNLSVQITSETNESSSVIKTEDSVNQDLTFSLTSTSVQPEAEVNQNQQQSQENVLLTQIKTEPVELNDTENSNNVTVEMICGKNSNKRVQENLLLQETIPIAQIKTERIETEENNGSIIMCKNTPLKNEYLETISDNNNSIQIMPNEYLDDRGVEKEKNKEANVEVAVDVVATTTDVKTESINVNNVPTELNVNTPLNTLGTDISKENEKLDNLKVENNINFPTSSKEVLTDDNLESVKKASQNGVEDVINNAQDNWGEFEEEKLAVTGTSYESVLTAFNTTRLLDPNRVLCPYELMGTCNDDSCTYNHLDANRKT